MNLLTHIKNINPYLLILDILFLIVSFLFLNKKKYQQRIKDLFIIIYTMFHIFLFKYPNNFFNTIFNSSTKSIKIYLICVAITYAIFLYTINKRNLNKNYKTTNYILFAISNINLIINIAIILSFKINFLPNINIINYQTLTNIMIFTLYGYILVIAILYIIETSILIKNNQQDCEVEEELVIEEILEKEESIINETTSSVSLLSIEELLSYNRNNPFYINGIDCSIIFNDSIEENIIKNYYILTNDINAKMVNGYTLDENIMLKNICEKLNTNSLLDINLDNFNILNKISIEEYNLLKKIKNY